MRLHGKQIKPLSGWSGDGLVRFGGDAVALKIREVVQRDAALLTGSVVKISPSTCSISSWSALSTDHQTLSSASASSYLLLIKTPSRTPAAPAITRLRPG